MKNIFVVALFLVFSSALAQTKKDTLELLNFKFRWYNTSPCGCYTFPKKDSIYIPKDTLKPAVNFTFVRKKDTKKYFRA
ncbi:MAG: hypothetical protein PHC28_16245 [Flavobacterium sp.]|uniref:hypothetical protein n=1 Tax=Flavobacterium sp. TaxID=239 RepID=UPI00262C37D2|nr:hypothetical protein [Flavobacterium sp.]MDD5152004.1 hypothetical protein [Flavobacterium sp.]